MFYFFFFFKQKTAYEMRISDWSSDVCSSDLELRFGYGRLKARVEIVGEGDSRGEQVNELRRATVEGGIGRGRDFGRLDRVSGGGRQRHGGSAKRGDQGLGHWLSPSRVRARTIRAIRARSMAAAGRLSIHMP